MTPRERFVETLCFGTPDRVPLKPGWPRESTLAAWHQQGLPVAVDWCDYLMEELGIDHRRPKDPAWLDVSLRMEPAFEEKVLAHENGHYVVQDWMGAITEISDEYDYTYIRNAKDFVTRKWHRFPVESRADFVEKIAWRYDADDPGRYPDDLMARGRELRDRETELRLTINGPFWQMREWCGMEGLCRLMIDDPEFVSEMAEFWTSFVLSVLQRVLPHIVPDYVQVGEDMAYKRHSMISPAMTRRFLMPSWERWGKVLKAHGCPVYAIDSDGYIAELLPLFLEAGFGCVVPMEVAAGNDIVTYRREYGRRLAIIGGIDKRALAAGGEVMETEVERVVPPLLEQGGYIPGCDHGVPPDISWPNFIAYTRRLAFLTGWL